MDTTKVILGTVVGTIVLFLAGWLVYGILLADMMKESLTPEGLAVQKEPDLVLILISNLVMALLYTYIFERWANIRTWQTGAVAAGTIGILIATSIDLSFMSMTKMYTGMNGMFVDILASTAMSALAGAAIGFTLGYNRK